MNIIMLFAVGLMVVGPTVATVTCPIITPGAFSPPSFKGGCNGVGLLPSVEECDFTGPTVSCSFDANCLILTCSGTASFTATNRATQDTDFEFSLDPGTQIVSTFGLCDPSFGVSLSGTVEASVVLSGGASSSQTITVTGSVTTAQDYLLATATPSTPVVGLYLRVLELGASGTEGALVFKFALVIKPTNTLFQALIPDIVIYTSNTLTYSSALVTEICALPPAPAPGSDSDSSTCFPATARVTVANGTTITMAQLQIGDSVSVGANGKPSPVYMFSHQYPEAKNTFVEISTASGQVYSP
jgi:hypothetical protein